MYKGTVPYFSTIFVMRGIAMTARSKTCLGSTWSSNKREGGNEDGERGTAYISALVWKGAW